ncbi:enhancer of mRNA-decapping protein 4 isoform X1 [Oryza glaberrima]|uniref:Enhancer of mRNA-decapping protein 4 WD40 repeat region domain-containing protein n=2 Tax=Oryza glaberrima TaxID=4538 RepID=I1Q1T6_ORYGL|nr:enhancer of mRNA-decapping protein 4 isoform X1 [Oryza glaberrima]
MASPSGNPNPTPNQPFELNRLFKQHPPASASAAPNPNHHPAPAGIFPGAAAPAPHHSVVVPPPMTSGGGPYSYPPATPPFHRGPYLPPYPNDPHLAFAGNPNPPAAAAAPNPAGARLMQLLGNTAPTHLESAVSMPMPSEFSAAAAVAPPAPLPAMPSAPPARMPSSSSSKMPRGRLLGPGDRAVHDVDSRLPGEAQPPQLEVTPITKYTSDPGLVLGRQIAVNRTYIVYGLKLGNIRVLNINTALRSLLRGHTQRVTDMAFFAEDVHRLASASVDGRIYVWKIDEGPDEQNKPQITGKIEIAIQIVGDAETYHPRICWHSHKQEILFVGVANCVLKIDTTKVGRGMDFSREEPLKCPLDKLVDGVHLVGKHDADITDLSLSQWMTTRLASASKDGMVKIWDDRKSVPLSVLKPHDGQAVYSVSFLTAPEHPQHINLITAGPLNREVKIWASTNDEGWLLPSDSETWRCTQTLELVSSLEHRFEEAFFNQVAVLPQASLILLANAKKNAIYAVHVEYGPDPASTRLDYIADFTVAMPILSLTGTHESQLDTEQIVQVYCVQTMAIQQYGLELSLCLPPTADNPGFGRDPAISHVYERPPAEVTVVESSKETSLIDSSVVGPTKPASNNQALEANVPSQVQSTTPPSSIDLGYLEEGALRRGPSRGPSLGDRDIDPSSLDYSSKKRMNSDGASGQGSFGRKDSFGKEEPRGSQGDGTKTSDPCPMFKVGGNATHLITPSEIISGVLSSPETIAIGSSQNVEVDAKHVAGRKSEQSVELEAVKETQIVHEKRERPPKTAEQTVNTISERLVTTDKYSVEDSQSRSADGSVSTLLKHPSGAGDENTVSEAPEKTSDGYASRNLQLTLATKEEKVLHPQVSGQLSPSTSTYNSADSSHEPPSNVNPPIDNVPQVGIQETLQQLMAMHSDLQKQLSTIVSAPIAKEGKRIETSLGRNMEKSIKANIDAMWARFQEENAKHEKAERERMQHITTLITTAVNKDIPVMLEKSLKKEISSVGPAVARTTAPIIEKSLSSAVSDSLQKVLGDKVVNQLDKSLSTKLEATVARQIQTQFHTSAKQALQDALRSSFESTIIPAFEQSCKTMFEQVDGAFQKGMSEHGAAIRQQVATAHTPLAQTLRETIASASSINQGLASELLDGQRKLLALVSSGGSLSHNTSVLQPSNGPVASLPEVDAPLDPVKELSRLISERKFDEAFTMALQRSDVSIVSWLCSQVDLHELCRMNPIPLNQGVLLALFQQLACDIVNDTPRKLEWMTAVAVAISPTDPMIAVHVRPIFEQVYGVLNHQRSLPASSSSEATNIRLIMHVINSVLLTYK